MGDENVKMYVWISWTPVATGVLMIISAFFVFLYFCSILVALFLGGTFGGKSPRDALRKIVIDK